MDHGFYERVDNEQGESMSYGARIDGGCNNGVRHAIRRPYLYQPKPAAEIRRHVDKLVRSRAFIELTILRYGGVHDRGQARARLRDHAKCVHRVWSRSGLPRVRMGRT